MGQQADPIDLMAAHSRVAVDAYEGESLDESEQLVPVVLWRKALAFLQVMNLLCLGTTDQMKNQIHCSRCDNHVRMYHDIPIPVHFRARAVMFV